MATAPNAWLNNLGRLEIFVNLHEKLYEVGKSLDYFQKANSNKQQGFDYVSSTQVVTAIKRAVIEQRLLLIPRVVLAVFHPKGTEKMNTTEISMEFTWMDIDNPKDTLTVPWYAQGCDQHEKGVGKALTYAEKYFILKFFQVPTDKDDPDAFEEKNAPPKPSSGIKWVAKSLEDARSELWQWYLHLYGTNDKACKVLYQEYSKESVNDLTEEQVKEAWAAGRKADK